MKERWDKSFIAAILLILLTACSTPTPPLEFAPDGDIIQKAIALQLSQTQQRLSQQLNASRPKLEINQINVKKIEPIVVANLAAYHLSGTYNLTLRLPRQKVKQSNNYFDIYLQRQIEGKTWRLLKREVDSSQKTQWSSYLIH
jgi:hydroxypyruvate isomerase